MLQGVPIGARYVGHVPRPGVCSALLSSDGPLFALVYLASGGSRPMEVVGQ